MPEISIDEMMALRKGGMNGDVLSKAVKTPPSWNPEKRSLRFVMSAEVSDRDGDVIMVDGIDIADFTKNPVSLWLHNQAFPIGAWEGVEKVPGRPKRLEGDHIFMPEGTDETADRIARIAGAGFIRACSVGFLPDWHSAEAIVDDDKRFVGIRFNKTGLVECSVVSIPANQRALAKLASDEDRKLAAEIIEEVLDNWTKTPAGLFMTKAEYEASLKTAQGEKTFHPVIDVRSATIDPPADEPSLLTRIAKALGVIKEEPPKPAPPALASEESKSAASAKAEAALKRAELLAQGA